MVSINLLNIDFYGLREEIRREILKRIENIEIVKFPLETAWLLYALLCEGRKNNVPFENQLKTLENWVLSDSSGTKDKDLAPLSLAVYLSENEKVHQNAITKIKSILERNIEKEIIPKFNVLNDPEQVFCLSLINQKIPQELKNNIIEKIKKNITGSVVRKIFFSAALFEFGINNNNVTSTIETGDNAESVILSLWFVERYRGKISPDTNLLDYWSSFEKVYQTINIHKSEQENYLAHRDLALLYEAVLAEIKEPNPNMLFNLYPFHPEIKKITQDHFKSKKYVSAVFEATKKLNEIIQNLTGIKDKSEAELVQATMEQISNPNNLIIQFNDFLSEDSGKNEHSGLALIAKGIFKAFRNPKGHKPEDHPLLEIEPYEALAQLITIDYIFKRVEKAKIKKR
ncbi:MAG: TIGR02391 family protein [candidate division WOR-3 bacterium]